MYLLAAAERDTARCIWLLEQYLAGDKMPGRRKLRRELATLKDDFLSPTVVETTEETNAVSR